MLKAKLSDKSFEEIASLLSKIGVISIDALKTFIFEETNTAFGLEEQEEEYLKKIIVRMLISKHQNLVG